MNVLRLRHVLDGGVDIAKRSRRTRDEIDPAQIVATSQVRGRRNKFTSEVNRASVLEGETVWIMRKLHMKCEG